MLSVMFVWPAIVPPSVFRGINWILRTNFSTKFFGTCHALGHIWLLPSYTTFSDLNHGSGSQGQHKAKPIGFSHTLFNWMRSNLIWWRCSLSLTYWDYFLLRFIGSREILGVTKCIKKLQCRHACKHLWTNLVQTWYDTRYYWTLHFDTSLLNLDSRSQECPFDLDFSASYLPKL